MGEGALLGLCEYIVSKGMGQGASAVEVLARSASEMESTIEMGQTSSVNRKTGDEISIRIYSGRRMGSAFTNITSREAAEETLSLALMAASASTEDPDWLALPEPSAYPKVRDLWYDPVVGCEASWVVDLAGEFMDRAVEAESGLIPAFGGAGVGYARTAYANSNGISHSERGTIAYAYLEAIAKTQTGVTPGIGSYEIRRSLDLDLERVVDDITGMIRICKETAEGSTGKHTVIMHPIAYGQLLRYTLLEGVKGDNVARGKSKLGSRIGEEIASDLVTIVDDGVNPLGVNTSVADDEGIPRRCTPIIKEGVLHSFLWDTYWANKMGEESTGNARRNMRQGLVELATTNMVVEPGTRDIQDIISEVDHGYLVRNVQGAHSSNPESGDFSVVGNPAVRVEGGEMVGAVHGLMVSGNVFELLNQVTEKAKTPIVLQGLIGPEIVFGNVNVIARG
jgi:PmbA protein